MLDREGSTASPSVVARMCGGIFVVVHGRRPPTDPEWDEAVAYIDARIEGVSRLNVLVRAESGPNVIQRARLNAVIERVPTRTAVLSASPVVRGIIIAVRWTGLQDVKSFAPTAVSEGLDFLELPRSQHEAVARELQRMIAMVDLGGESR